MAIIEAYQCEVTGKKFFIKEEYENHTRVLKNKQRALSYTKMPSFLIEQKFNEMRETCSTEDELNEWIAEHLWVFDASAYVSDPFHKTPAGLTLDDIKNDCLLESVVISGLTINKKVPRFNYNSRFSVLPCYDNADAIDKYQVGLTGNITIVLKSFNDTEYTRRSPTFLSSVCKASGIHIGGGGSQSSRYQAHLLMSEWPRFAERAIFEKLSSD